MKLKLPTALLCALLACYMLPAATATDTVNLNTYDWNSSGNVSFSNVNLSVNGYWNAPDKFIQWTSTNQDTYSLVGTAVIEFNSLYQEYFGHNNGIIMYGLHNREPIQYTIDRGIILKNATLEARDGAYVIFSGSTDTTKDKPCIFYVNNESTIDLRQATIHDEDYIKIQSAQGTIIRNNYTVSDKHGLEIWYPVGSNPTGYSLYKGNLTLGAKGQVVFWSLRDAYQPGNPIVDGYMSIEGTLSITAHTQIRFHDLNHGDFDNSLPILSGRVIFYCNEILGDISLLSPVESWWKDWISYETITQTLDDKKFVSIVQPDGRYAITLVDAGNEPISPGSVITDGKAPSTLNDHYTVSLNQGGTVDASAVVSGLNNSYIHGTGGTLVTHPSQSFAMSGADTLGFSIVGTNGNAGADIQIGRTGGSITDASITLTGDKYVSKQINVQSGLLEIAQNTVLGTVDSMLTVGSSNASNGIVTASVNNRGIINNDVTINSGASMDNRNTINGDVLVNTSSILSNNGTVKGEVTVSENGSVNGSGTFGSTVLQSNALLYVGNSPGFQQHGNLTLNAGSRLGFHLGGITAATLDNHGSGTYSNLSVTNTLHLNGKVNTEVEVGLGILASGTDAFTLALIKTNGTVSGDGDFVLSLDDEKHLLKEGSLLWNASTGTLSFTGQVDEAVAAALVGKDGSNIANSLWSSTSVVKSFAQTAVSQLNVVQSGKSNIWVGGLGDFVTMNSTSHADGFQYNGGGYAAGIDYACTKKFRAGIALGQTFGTFKSDDNQASIKQDSIMTGLYANYQESLNDKQSLGLSGYFVYGSVENKANTLIGNSSYLPGHATWNDNVFTFGLKADWNIQVTGKTTLTPFIGLDYVNGSQETFTETYTNGSRQYRNGSMQVWSVPVGITVKKEVSIGGGQLLLPELTVSYVGDVSRRNPSVKSTIYGIDNKHEGSNPGRSAFMLQAGTNWIMNQNWSVGAFYTLETRSGQVNQSASLSTRYSF